MAWELSLALESGFSAAPFTEGWINKLLIVALCVSVFLIGQSGYQIPKSIYIGVGNGNRLYACPENSMNRRAWQATVHGVIKIQTWLSTHRHTYTQFLWKLKPYNAAIWEARENIYLLCSVSPTQFCFLGTLRIVKGSKTPFSIKRCGRI